MKTFLISLFTITLITIGGIMSLSSFGKNPFGEHLATIQNSPQYNLTKEAFVNQSQEAIRQMNRDLSLWGLLKDRFSNKPVSVPTQPLPEHKPDMEQFTQGNNLKYIWLGHSTFLLHINGKVVLFDPLFSTHAAPVPLAVKRFQDPVIDMHELPHIDAVVISHDHYDHLDMKSIQFFNERDKEGDTLFYVPLGVGSHMVSWGIDRSRITELDWWESVQHEGVEFIATPSQHFSGRGLVRNQTLWASWVVRSRNESVYFSGDSGYAGHFKEIGEKYGPFDLTFLENGQYNHRWRAVHMLPEETIQAQIDLRGRALVPIHWGMFNLSLHNWWDPIETSYALAEQFGVDLMTPQIGQLVEITDAPKFSTWWRPLMEGLSSGLAPPNIAYSK